MSTDLDVTAHHEAGHFIVHASIGYPKAPSLEITPVLSKQRSGYYHPGDNSLAKGSLDAIWVALAGPLAEYLYSNESPHPLELIGSPVVDIEDAVAGAELLIGESDFDRISGELARQLRHVSTLLHKRWRHVVTVASLVLASKEGRLGPEELAPWLGGVLPQWRRFERECDRCHLLPKLASCSVSRVI